MDMQSKRPEDQTRDEWLADYSGCTAEEYRKAKGVGSDQKFLLNLIIKPDKNLFRYIDHRTTSKGSVAMDFESIDGGTSATVFFNVGLRSNRSKNYPSGNRGQFIPPPKGNFRKFWIQAVGKEPPRWCRVHKSMGSKLGGLVFTGNITQETDSKGKPYNKLRNARAIK
jgi:hypothetical protein